MESTPEGNINSLDHSVRELAELNVKLHDSGKKPYLSLNMSVSNIMLMMSAMLNSAYNGKKSSWISFTHDDDWHLNMVMLNRNFFNTLLNCLEKALEGICDEANIKIEIARAKQATDLMDYLKDKNIEDPKIVRLVKSLSSSHPSFDDYLNAVVNNTSMDKETKRYWRKVFKDLSTLRNKSSHSNSRLSQHEYDELKSGVFTKIVVSKEEIRFSVLEFKEIYKIILSFFDDVEKTKIVM